MNQEEHAALDDLLAAHDLTLVAANADDKHTPNENPTQPAPPAKRKRGRPPGTKNKKPEPPPGAAQPAPIPGDLEVVPIPVDTPPAETTKPTTEEKEEEEEKLHPELQEALAAMATPEGITGMVDKVASMIDNQAADARESVREVWRGIKPMWTVAAAAQAKIWSRQISESPEAARAIGRALPVAVLAPPIVVTADAVYQRRAKKAQEGK